MSDKTSSACIFLLDHFGDNAGATVLPPSRMANRRPLSMAIGVMSLRRTVMLSPGITISTPSAGYHARHVRRPEVELRTIPHEERRVPAAFFLRQNVDFGLELRVRRDADPAWPEPARAPRLPS